MRARQQSPSMKSLWNLALRLDSAVSPWTLCVRCTELLTFDSMLSCKLEGCLKIKCQDSTDKCVVFPHLLFSGCGLNLYSKNRAAARQYYMACYMKSTIFLKWQIPCWWRAVTSAIKNKTNNCFKEKEQKEGNLFWMESDSIEAYTGVLHIYYAPGLVS